MPVRSLRESCRGRRPRGRRCGGRGERLALLAVELPDRRHAGPAERAVGAVVPAGTLACGQAVAVLARESVSSRSQDVVRVIRRAVEREVC